MTDLTHDVRQRRLEGADIGRNTAHDDRLLDAKRTLPDDLPAQAPTKYELIVNLRTAKVLSLAIPATILTRADEVIGIDALADAGRYFCFWP